MQNTRFTLCASRQLKLVRRSCYWGLWATKMKNEGHFWGKGKDCKDEMTAVVWSMSNKMKIEQCK